ncbi:MAG: DUF262 domain-containing protein, partial [Flavobacterium sp.]
IPDYQREMIWKHTQKSRFIESLLINLPVPYLFFADNEEGRSEVIDGSQRLRTIIEFLQDSFELKNLKLLTSLNNFKFSNLPAVRQRRFKKKTIRVIEMTQNMDEEARREMFDRLNTGGTNLKPMEQRRGSQDGAFLKFISELAKNKKFIQLCPISGARKERKEYEELVLRFFAYLNNYKNFEHRVDEFLNEYLQKMNETDFDSNLFSNEFNNMLNFVEKHFIYGFKKNQGNNSVPRIRFEAIAVGIGLALRVNPQLNINDVYLLTSKEFGHLTRSDASNSKPKVKNRIHFVRDNLLGNEVEYEGDISSIFSDPRQIDPQPNLFD